jgi:hypothetical protein
VRIKQYMLNKEIYIFNIKIINLLIELTVLINIIIIEILKRM